MRKARVNKAKYDVANGVLKIDGTAVTTTAAELNLLDGCTATTAELSILSGVTSTAAELSILDGCTCTYEELNILDGCTCTYEELNLLDGCTATTEELSILSGVTSTAAEINILDGCTCTYDELNHLDLSAVGMLQRIVKITPGTTPDGSEEDSGIDLPTSGVVNEVYVNVTTAEVTGATKTLDVGLLSGEAGGDANGFLAAVDVSSTGLKKGTLVSTGQTLGALLYVDEDGAGTVVPEPHVLNGTAVSVSYTAGSNDWVEFVGDIYVVYKEIG
jgi:hypothetical protein